MPEWICLKCKYKWVDESKKEPRYCPVCNSATINVKKK